MADKSEAFMPPHANGRIFHPAEQLSGALFSPPNASFQLYGFVDGVHGRCVDGWIFDAASPDSTLWVEIRDGTRQIGEAQARLFRADLDTIGMAIMRFVSSCRRIFSTARCMRSRRCCGTPAWSCRAVRGV